jgi:hypothetical protein
LGKYLEQGDEILLHIEPNVHKGCVTQREEQAINGRATEDLIHYTDKEAENFFGVGALPQAQMTQENLNQNSIGAGSFVVAPKPIKMIKRDKEREKQKELEL